MVDRRNLTMRDMALAMGVIVVAVLLVVGLYGGFTVSPGRPDTSDAVTPTADVVEAFGRTDRNLGFVAAVPVDLPADWHESSWSSVPAGDTQGRKPTARGGWLTPDGRFITLIQSTGTLQEVLTTEFPEPRPVTGSVEVDGVTWQVGTGMRDEVLWARQLGELTVLITGSASEADFRILAGSLPAEL